MVGVHVLQVACFVALGGVWELIARTSLWGIRGLAAPTAFIAKAAQLTSTGSFYAAVGSTMSGWLYSLVLSMIFGVILGTAIGSSRIVDSSTSLTVDFLRSIPKIALLPLGLLLLGSKPSLQVVVGSIAGTWPILLQVAQGVRQVDPVLAETAHVFRLSRPQYLRTVLLPSSGIYLFTGIRLASVTIMYVVIGAELFGGVPGIGYQMFNTLELGDTTRLYAWVLWSALISMVINLALSAVNDRLFSWHQSVRDGRP
jgi:ABC-type nitrate/sulfonate/bicarbonate transport system permease component